MTDIIGSAVISPCGLYRYRLGRQYPALPGRRALWLGVNPSTADAVGNDGSITRVLGFCTRWGISELMVGNVFAYRSTDVRKLAEVPDPVGPDNDDHLMVMADEADVVIAGWGNTNKVPRRLLPHFGKVIDLVTQRAGKDLMCWGETQGGDPKHP